jgi:hypothetical protein
MRLHEYLLEEDARLDLSDPKVAADWMASRPWWQREGARGEGKPYLMNTPAGAWVEFGRNVVYLRSLTLRLAERKPKRPSPGGEAIHAQADAALEKFLGLMRLRVTFRQQKRKARPRPYLDRGSFGGVVVQPTQARRDGERVPVAWGADCFHDLEVFWQCAFYSLAAETPLNVCSGCGRELDATTKGGRPARQQFCGGCSQRRWRRKQSPEAMREKWKRDKRRQRA